MSKGLLIKFVKPINVGVNTAVPIASLPRPLSCAFSACFKIGLLFIAAPLEIGVPLAAKFGTVAVVSDPHEIANVCGRKGIEFMIEDAENAALKIFFSLPSSVPASCFETSGACIDAVMTEKLLGSGKFVALSEMMNYPGVVDGNSEVMAKIEAAE